MQQHQPVQALLQHTPIAVQVPTHSQSVPAGATQQQAIPDLQQYNLQMQQLPQQVTPAMPTLQQYQQHLQPPQQQEQVSLGMPAPYQPQPPSLNVQTFQPQRYSSSGLSMEMFQVAGSHLVAPSSTEVSDGRLCFNTILAAATDANNNLI
jgi:hypothetical protein